MPFQQDQIDRLTQSFGILEPRLDAVVSDFYSSLFDKAPAVRSLFPANMETQHKHLTSALKLVASHIGHIDNLATPLRELGARHVGYGAQEEHYPVVRDTLIASMAEVSGYTWTAQVEQDWTDALNTIAGFMIEGQRQAESKAA